MYKKIIVPIDLSHQERIDSMVAAAKVLASGGKAVLVHVVEDIPAFVAAQIPEDVVKDTQSSAEERLKEIAAESGLDAEIDVRHGHAANTILDIAEERGADCIVIASHKPHWEDYLIGSTAARVVRHAKCAVHVLR